MSDQKSVKDLALNAAGLAVTALPSCIKSIHVFSYHKYPAPLVITAYPVAETIEMLKAAIRALEAKDALVDAKLFILPDGKQKDRN